MVNVKKKIFFQKKKDLLIVIQGVYENTMLIPWYSLKYLEDPCKYHGI